MEIPAGYAQCNLQFTGDVLPTGAECTFGLDIGSLPTNLLDLATQVAAAYVTAECVEDVVAGVELSSILIKAGPNATGPSVVLAVNVPGTATGQSVGPNTAFLIQKNTNFGGRAGRGRMYLPGPSESAVDQNGLLNGSGATVVGGHWDDYLNLMAIYGTPLVLLHSSGSPLTSPTVITSMTCDARVATQRRRNRR
jgi:hypothetical protein